MKKFREWNVSKVMVVDADDGEEFEKKLEKLMDAYNVIDIQYSTNDESPFYSALVLVINK